MSSLSQSTRECVLGAHLSTSKGLWNALKDGDQIKATGIQLFTANQRQWTAKTLVPEVINEFKRTMDETKVKVNISHASYLINLGSNKPELLTKSRNAFALELERCQRLGLSFMTFHPGAALDATPQECMNVVIESLLEMRELVSRGPTQVLIESTAGQGSCVGFTFEQLAYLIRGVGNHIVDHIGICLDTCHMFAAGYDMRTEQQFDHTLKEFDRIVGLKYLKAFHVNDSLGYLGSRVDRHAMLGEGHIGWEAFCLLMTDPRTADIPKYLETPGNLEIWKQEIQQLRSFVQGAPLPENKPNPKMKYEDAYSFENPKRVGGSGKRKSISIKEEMMAKTKHSSEGRKMKKEQEGKTGKNLVDYLTKKQK